MKKLIWILVVALIMTTFSCAAFADMDDVKFGVILLHDEDSTYDLNFINGVYEAAANLGLSEDQIIIKRNIPEGNECYEAALELADEGCNIIFADSFGHETYLIEAAREAEDVQFCHATGTMAHIENLPNYHNAFAAIYEGRYLAGVAAGMKLNEIKANGGLKGDVPMMGYVGAFTYAEVISGYSSFYLGAKSVCPDVIMKVQFTGSWYDEKEEKAAAEALIAMGCDLISQHADSMGAPTACENAGIPNVSYNGSTVASCPNTFIVSSRINWAPYFEYICTCVANGEEIVTDWTGTIATGSVVLTDVNTAVAAEGTVEAIEATKMLLIDESIHVYDTSTFTVEGERLTMYIAELNFGEHIEEVWVDFSAMGYFPESKYRSAPYFDYMIDGIEMLNQLY